MRILMSPSSCLSHHHRGFTLTEAVMVLVIILFTGMLIVPKIGQFINAWNIDVEASKLRAKIRMTQQLAVSEQKTYRMKFNITNQTFTIDYESIIGSSNFDKTYESVKVGSGIGISSTNFTSGILLFNNAGVPSGFSPPTGNIILTELKASPRSITIKVAAVTGKVDVQ